MTVVRFRERLAGALLEIERAATVTVPPRGPSAGDGLLAAARAGYSGGVWMHPRDGVRIELRGLDVQLCDRPMRDGWRGEVRRGIVSGLGRRPMGIAAGFADLTLLPVGDRRLYYRVAIEDADDWLVLEGSKEVRHGVWWESTVLFARVIRLAAVDALRLAAAGRSGRLEILAGEFDGAEPIAAGTLRVRELVRRGLR